MSVAMTSGLDLRLERTRARVKAQDIAALTGVSKSRIAEIERTTVVTPAWAERYRDALAKAEAERAA